MSNPLGSDDDDFDMNTIVDTCIVVCCFLVYSAFIRAYSILQNISPPESKPMVRTPQIESKPMGLLSGK